MREPQARAARIAAFMLIAAQASALTAVQFTDDFTGGADPYYWGLQTNQPLFDVEDSGGRLCFSKPEGGTGITYDYVQVSFSCEIAGDFDLSVEFSDGFFDLVNGVNGNAAGLEAEFGPQHIIVSRGDEATNGESAWVWLAPQFQLLGVYPTDATSGSLRLVRNGTTVSAYLNDVLLHQASLNSEQLNSVKLSLANNSTTDPIEVCFDNFSVTADAMYCNDVSQGMVAFYPFDGDATDASGNGNDGIVNGATLATGRWGNPESAYAFDGIDDHVRVPRSESLDITASLSLTAWIRVDSFPDYSPFWASVVEKELGGRGYNLHIRYDHGFHTRVDGANFDSSFLHPDRWYHLATVYDGMFVRSYIDGTEVGQGIEWPPTMLAAKDLYIGSWYLNRFFEGIIDDIRIYDRSLSESELQMLWLDSPIVFADGFESGNSSRWLTMAPHCSLTFFDDRAAFISAFPGLIEEDFEEGNVAPGGITVCSDPYDWNTSDACWSPGDIATGLRLGSSGGGGTVILGEGLIGQPTIVSGANMFSQSTYLEFPYGVHQIGFDLLSDHAPENIEVRILGPDGVYGVTHAPADVPGLFWAWRRPIR